MGDFAKFKKCFLDTFTGPQQKTHAVDHLQNLYQFNKPFKQYLTEFHLVTSEAEIMEEHVLMHALAYGLQE